MAVSEERYLICIECMRRQETLSMERCVSCEQSVYNFDVLPRERKKIKELTESELFEN